MDMLKASKLSQLSCSLINRHWTGTYIYNWDDEHGGRYMYSPTHCMTRSACKYDTLYPMHDTLCIAYDSLCLPIGMMNMADAICTLPHRMIRSAYTHMHAHHTSVTKRLLLKGKYF